MSKSRPVRYANFQGAFEPEQIVPALDKVQRWKSVRTIEWSKIECLVPFANLPGIMGIEIYGGYGGPLCSRFSHYDRTFLYYNYLGQQGSVIRQTAADTYNHLNPFLVLHTSNKFDKTTFKMIPFRMSVYREVSKSVSQYLDTDDFLEVIYISLQ